MADTVSMALAELVRKAKEPRKRAEQALVAVVREAYVKGVSTRKVDGLVQALGLDGISKSQVSRLCETLDAEVERFRHRPLEGSYPSDPTMARDQWRKVADGFRVRYPHLAALLDDAEADVLAWPTWRSRASTGGRSGRTTRSSGSTRRSSVGPMWSACSRTTRP